MAEKREIYKCQICGNIVEVVHGGKGQLVCCGQDMELLEEKTADSSTEKHVPYIKRENGKYIVKIGENAEHPMEEKHYIEWIELEVDGAIMKKYLQPGDKPEAIFECSESENISAREMCNVHGVWKK